MWCSFAPTHHGWPPPTRFGGKSWPACLGRACVHFFVPHWVQVPKFKVSTQHKIATLMSENLCIPGSWILWTYRGTFSNIEPPIKCMGGSMWADQLTKNFAEEISTQHGTLQNLDRHPATDPWYLSCGNSRD